MLPGSQRTSRHSKEEDMLASRLAETTISGYPEEQERTQEKSANKKKFASKMRSIVSAVKTAQRLEVWRRNNEVPTIDIGLGCFSN